MRVRLYCCHCDSCQRWRGEVGAVERGKNEKYPVVFATCWQWVGGQWDCSQCTCCRDGGLGWALGVRRGLSCGASVCWKHPPMLALQCESWAGGVVPGRFWLGVGVVECFCFYSASWKWLCKLRGQAFLHGVQSFILECLPSSHRGGNDNSGPDWNASCKRVQLFFYN